MNSNVFKGALVLTYSVFFYSVLAILSVDNAAMIASTYGVGLAVGAFFIRDKDTKNENKESQD